MFITGYPATSTVHLAVSPFCDVTVMTAVPFLRNSTAPLVETDTTELSLELQDRLSAS